MKYIIGERGTGRTQRIIELAIQARKRGESVLILVPDKQQVKLLEDRVLDGTYISHRPLWGFNFDLVLIDNLDSMDPFDIAEVFFGAEIYVTLEGTVEDLNKVKA